MERPLPVGRLPALRRWCWAAPPHSTASHPAVTCAQATITSCQQASGGRRTARLPGSGSERLPPMTYVAAPDRYEQIPYRRCGRSGIELPAISLGLWQNFGDDRPLTTQRAIIRRAFDLGV